jgi:23S rRNA (adenine2503-C2)-methyltransferase
MGCAFCLTAKMGLVRQLTAGEIAGQVRVLSRAAGLAAGSFNVVLMGMGEPLHNFDATMKALRILADPHGLAIAPKRVTLSTVGWLPGLERLASEPLMPNLAVSLHATTGEGRTRLVPVNQRYDLHALIDVCRRFPLAKRRRITFEYVLLAEVNDMPEDARRLARLLSGVRAKVNLLPLNEAPGIPFTRPSDARVNAFGRILAERGVTVSIRKSRGRDIRAACGQLIAEGGRQSAGESLAARMSVGVTESV